MLNAIIQPSKLDDVQKALSVLGVEITAVSEVRGFGRQKGHTAAYSGVEYSVDFLPKLRIEVVLEAELLDQAVEVIENAAGTGKIGDGKIFVFELE